jgi:hypothetical protein
MMLSAGWIAAGIPQLELELETALENPILLVALPVKKATELVARKARTTHVHTTVVRCSHSKHPGLQSGEHTFRTQPDSGL